MIGREGILDALLELTGGVQARTRDELLQQALRTARLLAQSNGASLVSLHQGRFERAVLGAGLDLPQVAEAPRRGSEFTRLLLRVSRPMLVADLAEDPRVGVEDGCPGVEAGPALFVPLRRREHAPGYLAVYRARGAPRFGPSDARQLILLAAWTAMSLENLRLASSVEKLAVTDDLTQVYNYRFIKTALKRELKRAARFQQELALVMIDVDNLKAYNDRNGHLRGSFLLKEMAGLLARQVRSFDLIAKYGGDEFTLILPQTGLEGALTVAERMRRAVAEHAFPLEERGGITVSLGLASFPADAEDGHALIRAADRALYVAKQQGRNQVRVFRDLEPQPGPLPPPGTPGPPR